ncbi:hypothetical protein A3K29_02210 [Candidatus Collierbacteria bacterium RIFOXYB2_FULL_46_14]|nr:MAG: hypothetical protein A3K29_02210 [Candidatus Collierbacteria bacterium RIFOXYB2_FULL_46_14]OGD75981.1 MAG: hypothetical protein A3K43_02210 [Candidatus Collierbacteria bacterium RIFOXYA2_FULL_46_20]OGD77317.1 MAG: hypothetical protein A3K39_02210 [Candidatus Collierbacteria bacterium RIFOXYC2_FULL_43_15]OGD80607.1 MAG: hypothetical protein A2320_02705 [Pseudomonadales bacterium GWC2_63_15]OGD82039.1 MAG: hypothetical protein A3K36_02210 [Candidatus Collierbacteria bacterium RIFOXYD2_FUL
MPRFGEGGGANLTLQLIKEIVFFQIRLRTGLYFLCTAIVNIFDCAIGSFVVLDVLLSRDGSAALPTPHQTGKSKVVTGFPWSRKLLNVTLDSFKKLFADESWMGSLELFAIKFHRADVEFFLEHTFDLVNLQRLPEGACYSPLCHEASNVNERVFFISKHFKSFSDDFGFFRIDVN